MKKKVLLLSTHDSHLGGHAWSVMKLYDKDRYNVRLISLYSLYNDKSYAIIKHFIIYRIFRKFIIPINRFLRWGQFSVKIKNNKYAFGYSDISLVSVKTILKKYGDGIPDIIVLHWYDGFITTKMIKELYDQTKAKIVFVFTDEFSLGGGCHYPCECINYKYSCNNCPAVYNKNIPHKILEEKILNLSNIPKVVIAPSAGINQAKQSSLFKKNTKYIKAITGLKLNINKTREDARSVYQIPKEKFVIMFGALNLSEERKGYKYILEALSFIENELDDEIIALVPGNVEKSIQMNNISFIYPGMLNFEELCNVYIASNVYISPSIADSGPMMVKYSIACGTPVIAFPIGYALDLIVHKETGYLAKYMSARDLADGILYFYNNKHKQRLYSDNCKKINEVLCQNECAYNLL